MGIQSLVATSVDKVPPKPKEMQKISQNSASANEKSDLNQQIQDTHQADNNATNMKQLTDIIAESTKIDMAMARVSFSKDKDTGDILIKIIDNKTDEVIKQIPPEEVLELKKRLGDMQGLLLDKRI